MSTLYPSFVVMVVDDEAHVLESDRTALRSAGITNVLCVTDSSVALEKLEALDVGVVLLDLTMPGISGEELIPLIRLHTPDIPIVVITGNRDVEKAVECMKAGVDDYLTKPVEGRKLVATVRRYVEIQELRRENRALSTRFFNSRIEHPEAFAEIITADEGMHSVMRYTEAVAKTSHPVLITGETGAGKDMIARSLHAVSGREAQYIAVNTAGLDDAMFSDTLFGHRAGAFTGAAEALAGLVERAAGGTLFLDEIGDLSQTSQVKLLRLLEAGEYYPLGADMAKKSEARIVVATNRNVPAAVEAGSFRMDLFYRLSTHHIRIPPLRDRREDIPLLARHFVDQAAAELNRKPPRISPDLLSLLQTLDYPGNVRELRSLVFDAVSRSDKDCLSAKDVGPIVSPVRAPHHGGAGEPELRTIRETVDLLVERALKKAQGNRAAAARILGITPQALGQRLKRAGANENGE